MTPAADVTRDSSRTRTMTKQIHLAAHFPGVNNTTVWSDPASGSHIEFDSFRQFAQTAERAKFDFFFLAEGLRLREQAGLIYDLDVVGRPDTFTVLAALAAVTDRVGQVRLLFSGRRAAAARTGRPHLRSRRGRPPGHVHGPGRTGRRHGPVG